ncbi:MAG: tetratricopeptide repeat protein [Polyangiaceae bacterium]|nr:tetratricopeptide repeat protein [Polyangiaceae bacterium]
MASRKSGGRDNLIHVQFGPNGGRVAPPAPVAPEPIAGVEPVTDLFTAAEVARLTGLSAARLRSLARAGVVAPSGERGGRPAYTFRDLIVVRTVKGLLDRRVAMRDVTSAVRALRESLPKVTRPLAELRVASDGQRVVVRADTGDFLATTGQLLLDFGVAELRDDVVRVLRPRGRSDRQQTAYDLYVRASELDEHPETVEEAERLYRRAIELEPDLAIAYTNLGNLHFRRGEEDAAVALYEAALLRDATQPEAQYNLGYVSLERGRTAVAIGYFEAAIAVDPRFADAHFYLAMAYESSGQRDKARPCWRRYLELEPTGTWADVAKKHL